MISVHVLCDLEISYLHQHGSLSFHRPAQVVVPYLWLWANMAVSVLKTCSVGGPISLLAPYTCMYNFEMSYLHQHESKHLFRWWSHISSYLGWPWAVSVTGLTCTCSKMSVFQPDELVPWPNYGNTYTWAQCVTLTILTFTTLTFLDNVHGFTAKPFPSEQYRFTQIL